MIENEQSVRLSVRVLTDCASPELILPLLRQHDGSLYLRTLRSSPQRLAEPLLPARPQRLCYRAPKRNEHET